MLGVVCEDGVKDPGETENGVNHHDKVVHPSTFEGENVAETPVLGLGLEEGEIHKQIPECC